MSSGDRSHDSPDPVLVRALLSAPVWALFERPFRVDVLHDIPYLAGYSVDGSVIFIDRNIPVELVSLIPFLLIHERVEKALIDGTMADYQEAHAVATFVEHIVVSDAGLNPDEYEAVLKPYIRSADHESVTNPPWNLDLTPYEDEHDKKVLRELVNGG
jgi:hypothetical protein